MFNIGRSQVHRTWRVRELERFRHQAGRLSIFVLLVEVFDNDVAARVPKRSHGVEAETACMGRCAHLAGPVTSWHAHFHQHPLARFGCRDLQVRMAAVSRASSRKILLPSGSGAW